MLRVAGRRLSSLSWRSGQAPSAAFASRSPFVGGDSSPEGRTSSPVQSISVFDQIRGAAPVIVSGCTAAAFAFLTHLTRSTIPLTSLVSLISPPLTRSSIPLTSLHGQCVEGARVFEGDRLSWMAAGVGLEKAVLVLSAHVASIEVGVEDEVLVLLPVEQHRLLFLIFSR